jgi:putative ABC transport system ATP-binding protein
MTVVQPKTQITPATGAPVIALENIVLNLTSAAGEVNILRDVSLTVDPGQTVGLVGPSGAGKTSLLMIVAGLEQSTEGRVVVGGYDYKGRDEDDLARFRRGNVGIVFQDFHLIATMTALENVALPLEFAGEANAFVHAAAALDAVGLQARTAHYPGQLSGGEQQRVALARAFVSNPTLLLADEPTGNLDQDTGDRIIDLMFALSEKHNTTMLLITHDPAIAQRCDRIIRIVDGRIDDSPNASIDDNPRADNRPSDSGDA